MQNDRSSSFMEPSSLGSQMNETAVAASVMQQQHARFPYMPSQHHQYNYVQQPRQAISNNMVCYRNNPDMLLSPQHNNNQYYYNNNNMLNYGDSSLHSQTFNRPKMQMFSPSQEQPFYRHIKHQQQMSPMLQHNMHMYHNSMHQHSSYNHYMHDAQQQSYPSSYPLQNNCYGDRMLKNDIDHMQYMMTPPEIHCKPNQLYQHADPHIHKQSYHNSPSIRPMSSCSPFIHSPSQHPQMEPPLTNYPQPHFHSPHKAFFNKDFSRNQIYQNVSSNEPFHFSSSQTDVSTKEPNIISPVSYQPPSLNNQSNSNNKDIKQAVDPTVINNQSIVSSSHNTNEASNFVSNTLQNISLPHQVHTLTIDKQIDQKSIYIKSKIETTTISSTATTPNQYSTIKHSNLNKPLNEDTNKALSAECKPLENATKNSKVSLKPCKTRKRKNALVDKSAGSKEVLVPFEWRRVLEGGAIVYYSPSKTKLQSLEEICEYLSTEGTCKCGLVCPLHPSEVFEFDREIKSKHINNFHTVPQTAKCWHEKKLREMASQKELNNETKRSRLKEKRRSKLESSLYQSSIMNNVLKKSSVSPSKSFKNMPTSNMSKKLNIENTAQTFSSTSCHVDLSSKHSLNKNSQDKSNERCEDYDSDATKSVSDMSTSNQYITSDDEDYYNIPVKYNSNKTFEKIDAKNLNTRISVNSHEKSKLEQQYCVQSIEEKRKLNADIQPDKITHNTSSNITAVSSSARYLSNNKSKSTQLINSQFSDVPSSKTHLLSRLSPVFSNLKDENSPIKLVENMVSGLLGTKNSLAEVTTQIMASETEKKKKGDSFIEFVGIKRTFCKPAVVPKSSHNDTIISKNDNGYNICGKLPTSNRQYHNSFYMKNNMYVEKKQKDFDSSKCNSKLSNVNLNNSNLHNMSGKTNRTDTPSDTCKDGTKSLIHETKVKQQTSVSLHYNSVPLQHRQIKTICQATSITEMFSDDEEEENDDCKELNSNIKENDIKIETKKVETSEDNATTSKVVESENYKCDLEKASELILSKEGFDSDLKDDPIKATFINIKNEKWDSGDFKEQKINLNDQIDDKRVKDENSKSDSVSKTNYDEKVPKVENEINEVVCKNNIVKKEHEINDDNKKSHVLNHEKNEVLNHEKINNYKVNILKINEKALKSNTCSSSSTSTLTSVRSVCDKNNGLHNSFEEGDDDDSRDTIVQSALEVEEGGKESAKNNERDKKEEISGAKKETGQNKSMESHLMMLSQSPATLFIPQATFQHPASANYLQSLAFSQVGLLHFGRVLNTTQASQNTITTTTSAIDGLTTNTKSEPSTSSGSSVESVLNESLAKLAESSKVSVGSPMLLVSQGNTSQPQLIVPDYNTLASFATLLPLHNPITFCTPTLFTLAPQNPFAFVSPTGALHMITAQMNNNEEACKDKKNDNSTANSKNNDKLSQETSKDRDKQLNVKDSASPKSCHVAPDSTGDPENVSSSGKVQDTTFDKFSKDDTNDEEKDDFRNERKRFLNKRSFNFYTKNRNSYSNSPVNKRKNLYSMAPIYKKKKSSNSVLKRKDCKIIYESSDTDNHDDDAYNKNNEFNGLNVRKNEKLRQDYSDISYVRKKSFPTLRRKLRVFRKDEDNSEMFNENEIIRKERRIKRRRKRNNTIDDIDFKKEERHLDGNLFPRRVLRKRSKQVFKGFFFKYKLRHNARLHHCCYGEKGCAMRDADKEDANNEISFCSICDNKKINFKDDLKVDVFEKMCATSDCMVSTTNNSSVNNLSNGSKTNEIKKVKNCADKKSKNVSFSPTGLIDTTSTTVKHSSMQSPIYSSTSTLPNNTDDHSIQSKRISSNDSKLPDEDRPASTTSSDDTIATLSTDDVDSTTNVQTNFSVGDLVWGPARGFPSWPGKLVSQSDVNDGKADSGKLWVKWFGDNSYAQATLSQLKTLSEGLETHHNARKSHRKGRKMHAGLEAAIQEAMFELDKQMFEKSKYPIYSDSDSGQKSSKSNSVNKDNNLADDSSHHRHIISLEDSDHNNGSGSSISKKSRR